MNNLLSTLKENDSIYLLNKNKYIDGIIEGTVISNIKYDDYWEIKFSIPNISDEEILKVRQEDTIKLFKKEQRNFIISNNKKFLWEFSKNWLLSSIIFSEGKIKDASNIIEEEKRLINIYRKQLEEIKSIEYE